MHLLLKLFSSFFPNVSHSLLCKPTPQPLSPKDTSPEPAPPPSVQQKKDPQKKDPPFVNRRTPPRKGPQQAEALLPNPNQPHHWLVSSFQLALTNLFVDSQLPIYPPTGKTKPTFQPPGPHQPPCLLKQQRFTPAPI